MSTPDATPQAAPEAAPYTLAALIALIMPTNGPLHRDCYEICRRPLGCRHLRRGRFDRRFGALRPCPVVIKILPGHRIRFCQGFGSCQPLLDRVLLALPLEHHGLGRLLFTLPRRHLGPGGGDRIFRLTQFCPRLQQLRLQHIGLNPRENLARLYEIPFAHQNLRQTSRHAGREKLADRTGVVWRIPDLCVADAHAQRR